RSLPERNRMAKTTGRTPVIQRNSVVCLPDQEVYSGWARCLMPTARRESFLDSLGCAGEAAV
ncbi:MAG: hypothetical protein WA005_18605, partial [Candidatus Binataceae bacterium]